MKFNVVTDKLESTAKFIRTYIQNKFPSLNVSILSAVYDLVIKPGAKVYVYMEEALETVRKSLFLSEMKNIEDPETQKAAYDNFASNYFVTRNKGKKAVATLVVTVGTWKTYTLLGSTSFSVGGLSFYPYNRATQVIRAEALAEVSDGAGGIVYEFQVMVEAEAIGSQYTAEANSDWNTTWAESAILKIKNPSPVDSGVNEEENQDMVTRIEHSMTVKNMVNDRSIGFHLRERFPQIINYLAIGHLDRELFRELIEVNTAAIPGPINVRIGGMVDLYVYTGIRKSMEIRKDNSIFVVPDGEGGYNVKFYLPEEIFFEFRDIKIKGKSYIEESGSDRAYIGREFVQSDAPMYIMTLQEKPFYELPALQAGSLFELETEINDIIATSPTEEVLIAEEATYVVDYAPSVQEISKFVTSLDQNERVILANYLVRGLTPCYVSCTLKIRLQDNAVVAAADMESFAAEFIQNITDPVFNVGDLVDKLKDNFPISRISLPVDINYRIYSLRNTLHDGTVQDEVYQEIIDLDAAFLNESAPETNTWVSRKLVKMIPDAIKVELL